MATELDVDEFLNHRSTDNSGGFLDKWKDDGKLMIFLHTKRKPIAVWQHKFPRVSIKEEDDEVVRRVFSSNFNCHEDEKVLKQQYKRDDDGERKAYPKKCPLCRMTEKVHEMVEEGKLSWTKPIFKFEASDPSKTIILHAGGVYNAFGAKDLEDEKKEEMKEAGISPKEAWKENAQAKLNYVFCVVDAEHPEKGVQIATETGLLGDKVKDVIADARESLGADEGNPFLNPFCIQWIYNKDEKEFGKKYRARRLEKIKVTSAIRELIESDPPDLSAVIDPFNIATMRAVLERHCLVKLPWDEIFDVKGSKKVGESKNADDGGRSSDSDSASSESDDPDSSSSDSPEQNDDIVSCEKCDAPMKATDTKCKKCGAEYEIAPDDSSSASSDSHEPAPPPRKRSEAKREKEAKAKGKKDKAKKASKASSDSEEPDELDKIPF